MTTTSIEWTDVTWNPVTGCSKVSAGCKHCYAERVFPRVYSARKFTDVQCHSERLAAPLHWRKPRRVFVNSMSDLFHPDVPDEFIDQVFAVMALCPQHTFQILTKRPERMLRYCRTVDSSNREDEPDLHGEATRDALIEGAAQEMYARYHQGDDPSMWLAVHQPLPNVWLGVSVEDQATADERIPLLLATPAAVRFVSAEPLLGPVNLLQIPGSSAEDRENLVLYFPLAGEVTFDGRNEPLRLKGGGIHWVIIGGESGGPSARPCDIDWIRDILRQCQLANVPAFVKQIGARPINWCAASLLDEEGDTPLGADECDIQDSHEGGHCWKLGGKCLFIRDRKGADPSEWPADLRVRELPTHYPQHPEHNHD